jgi:hypothetical protein
MFNRKKLNDGFLKLFGLRQTYHSTKDEKLNSLLDAPIDPKILNNITILIDEISQWFHNPADTVRLRSIHDI